MKASDKFNHSNFSRWINSRSGRIFRLAAGTIFLVVGVAFRHYPLGIASIIWSFFPLTAGGFDLCYISVVLGGALSGSKIRTQQNKPIGKI